MSKLFANNPSRTGFAPVRRIGVQSRSVTGTMPDGSRYESSLERDFMLLMQFDHAVDTYSPQPVVISYKDREDKTRRYTPDGLIQWRKDLAVPDPRPVLVEIKPREAFLGAWREWRPKFRAARSYAAEHGWLFDVYTERELRTPFLENVRFLLPYRRHESYGDSEIWIREKLGELGETTPQSLIRYLHHDRWRQAELLTSVWKLVADRRIGCDLDAPLTMTTRIWPIWD